MAKPKTNNNWIKFLQLCTLMKTPTQFENLFELFLTYTEREELAARFAIVKELIKGKQTQREIAESVKVSIAKITRGSNQLKTIDEDFITFIKNKIL